MKLHLFIFFFLFSFLLISCSSAQKNNIKTNQSDFHDIFPDTWVATDALGRNMPDKSVVGPAKTDQQRVVGIFYITWHDDGKNTRSSAPYSSDVTKILKKIYYL